MAAGTVLAVAVLGLPGSAAAQSANAPGGAPEATPSARSAAQTAGEAPGAAKHKKGNHHPGKTRKSPKKKTDPGKIISSKTSSFQYTPGVPTPTKAWKITYRSTSADGRPNVVSGTVIVPDDGRATPAR
ncbi:hypothetical protein ACFQ0X_40870 [Streptomyces rectiviolaceus]|uniref:hypothetical protein n=1 Tax=Streptomyces rectiviolaceus TaxID=332591 RepID=UPI003631837B